MKNKNSKDYTKFLIEFPYDKKRKYKKFKKENEAKKVRRQECSKINSTSRAANLKFFSDCLQKTINYYISKSGYNGDDIKMLLGINYSALTKFYENEDNRPLDFKLIYDLCIVLNVQFNEFMERLEGEF